MTRSRSAWCAALLVFTGGLLTRAAAEQPSPRTDVINCIKQWREGMMGRPLAYEGTLFFPNVNGVDERSGSGLSVLRMQPGMMSLKEVEYGRKTTPPDSAIAALRRGILENVDQFIVPNEGASDSFLDGDESLTLVQSGDFCRLTVATKLGKTDRNSAAWMGSGLVGGTARGFIGASGIPVDQVLETLSDADVGVADAKTPLGESCRELQFTAQGGHYRVWLSQDTKPRLMGMAVHFDYDAIVNGTPLWKYARTQAGYLLEDDTQPAENDRGVHREESVTFSDYDPSLPGAPPRKFVSEFEERGTKGNVDKSHVEAELLYAAPEVTRFSPEALHPKIPDGTETFVTRDRKYDGIDYEWRDGTYRPHTPERVVERMAAVADQLASPAPAANASADGGGKGGAFLWTALAAIGVAVVVGVGIVLRRSPQGGATVLAAALFAGTTPDVHAETTAPEPVVWSNENAAVCGVYAVYLAGHMLGRDAPLSDVVQSEFVGSQRGSTLGELVAASRRIGLQATLFYGLTTDDLAGLCKPVILHVRGAEYSPHPDHYVLLTATRDGQCIVADGAAGVKHWSLPELAARWEGAGVALAAPAVGPPVVPTGLRRVIGLIAGVAVAVGLLHAASSWKRKPLALSTGAATLLLCATAASAAWQAVSADAPLYASHDTQWVEKWFTFHFLPVTVADDLTNTLTGGRAVVIDARGDLQFNLGHIPGAVCIDPEQAVAGTAAIPPEVQGADRVIVYCNNKECASSRVVAQHLIMSGVKNVSVYEGGWDEYRSNAAAAGK